MQKCRHVKPPTQNQRLRAKHLDLKLQEELSRYDSAFIESISEIERKVATLVKRRQSFQKLRLMPEAIADLEEQAG